MSAFSLWGLSLCCLSFARQMDRISSAIGNPSYSETLGCESKGPITFNNRKGCGMEGLAARAHKPESTVSRGQCSDRFGGTQLEAQRNEERGCLNVERN